MKTSLCFSAAVLIGSVLFSPPALHGQILTSNPAFPPTVSPVGNNGFAAPPNSGPVFPFSGTNIIFKSFLDRPLLVTSSTPVGPDEVEVWDSNFSATGDIPGLPGGTNLVSTGAGPVTTVLHGKVGNVTGTFQTEMLAMDLSGSSAAGPFMLRESPTRQSLGQTTITNVGGGNFLISSFFDVFTEISTDAGQTWIPSSSGSVRLTLVPEPASASLAALCGLGLLLRRRRA